MVASTCVTPCWNPKQFLHLITLIKWGIVRVKPSCGQLGPRMTTGSSGRRAASWGFSQIWEFGNLSLRWRYPSEGACTWASANIIAGPLKDRVIQWDAILGHPGASGAPPRLQEFGFRSKFLHFEPQNGLRSGGIPEPCHLGLSRDHHGIPVNHCGTLEQPNRLIGGARRANSETG